MTAAAMTVTANATGDIDVSFPLNGCLRKFGMRRGHTAEDNSENGRKTICNQFRARDGFNTLMAGDGERDRIVLPLDYADRMPPSPSNIVARRS